MARKQKTVELSPNVSSNGWPKIQQGTHLTVRTFEDGRTELIWDDAQLLKEVQEAIASYEATVQTVVEITEEKVKKTRKKKATV